MDNPYSRHYGSLLVHDELLDRLAATGGREERMRLLKDFLSGADSPYEYRGLVFGKSRLTEYLADPEHLILDYIVENADDWEPDEVACFLLEVATDHARLQTGSTYFTKLNVLDVTGLPYAWDFICESFSEGSHAELVGHAAYSWRSGAGLLGASSWSGYRQTRTRQPTQHPQLLAA